MARFSLADPVRANAAAVLASLDNHGFRVHLVSGDQPAVVQSVAAGLSIGSWQAGALPEQKQGFVKGLQQQGRRVMMVGDGLNDAPVLALADVSVAIGQASDLARTAADIIAATKRSHDGFYHFNAVSGDALSAKATRGGRVFIFDENGNAYEVTTADVIQSNGVIHVVNSVLVPK